MVVRTAGLEPARDCSRQIFVPGYGFRRLRPKTRAPFGVWTIPSSYHGEIPRDLDAARLVSTPSALSLMDWPAWLGIGLGDDRL